MNQHNPLRRFFTTCCHPKFLFYYYLFALMLPNIGLSITEPMSIMARISNLLLPLGLYGLLLTLSRKPGKMIWILFPLVFFAAFQLVLLYLFGQSVIAVDMFLNVVTTNPGEAIELLDNLIPGVAGVFIVYLPALILGLCTMRMGQPLAQPFITKARKWSACTLGAGVICLSITLLTDLNYSAHKELYPLNATYNLYLAIERANKQIHYAETARDFRFEATTSHESSKETYVLVIGETARACNFSLYGYERNTNPQLAAIDGLFTFRDALTQSNTTHKSVPMLLSGASAEDFDRIYQEKSLITAFREAGFHTLFLSNQRPNHSFIDYFGMEAHEYHFLQEEQPGDEIPSDADLLKGVKQALNQEHNKLLIVLHTYGSHFNYRERYPRSMAYFTPDDQTDAKFKNRASLVNAYDNSLRFTDAILGELTTLLTAHGGIAAWLYTSDHGEDLFDDSRRCFLHASPVPTYYQIHVPLWIWLSTDYRTQYTTEVEALEAHTEMPVSTSLSLFHTLLQLGGLSTPVLADSLSLCSPSYHPVPRCYLDDHNRPVPLQELGLTDEDMQQFQRHGLVYE